MVFDKIIKDRELRFLSIKIILSKRGREATKVYIRKNVEANNRSG
jgi:hypothetical protein